MKIMYNWSMNWMPKGLDRDVHFNLLNIMLDPVDMKEITDSCQAYMLFLNSSDHRSDATVRQNAGVDRLSINVIETVLVSFREYKCIDPGNLL